MENSALDSLEILRGQRRVAIQYDSFEVADRFVLSSDGLFRGFDVNVAASGAGRHSRFDLAAGAGGGGAAAAGGGAGDDEGDEEDTAASGDGDGDDDDDGDDDKAGDYVVSL